MQRLPARKVETVATKTLELKLAHSPDSDDAFMFYGLATKKISTGHLRFKHVLEDIETLNRRALEGLYDITALSFPAYAHISKAYALLPCGASFGDGYGPIVVARGPLGPEGLRGKRVAIPGKLTTAFLTVQLYEPQIEPMFSPFDRILERVTEGEADAGVVIHEGQLTYAQVGLTKVVDLGAWWYKETGLPLPLGATVIRRSLDRETIYQVAKLMRESVQYGLDHREETLAYAVQFSRGLDPITADRFVSMYVNERTLRYSEEDRLAVQTLLDRGFEKGLLPCQVEAEFAE
ncbi:MAG: ABC transporter substrate-binding protein [Acidobacteria bacterium]|nr:MAG: ABC transporter substrate-binding protein [Acidobacteriota bacterium]